MKGLAKICCWCSRKFYSHAEEDKCPSCEADIERHWGRLQAALQCGGGKWVSRPRKGAS